MTPKIKENALIVIAGLIVLGAALFVFGSVLDTLLDNHKHETSPDTDISQNFNRHYV
jgi:hypothetical protein